MSARQLRCTHRTMALAAIVIAGLPGSTHAQRPELPAAAADTLIERGRWAEAEELMYAAVRASPRDPVARARLGRYLAMKGALTPGLVLIGEAEQFGLSPRTSRALSYPIHVLLDWRDRERENASDSMMSVRAPSTPGSLLRLPLVRGARRDTVWADLVPRMIGLDSLAARPPRVGVETLEALVPELDVANGTLRLHADSRAALGSLGRRFPVLRTTRDVRVLLGPGRVRSLPDALRELAPRWWQLDLPHGLLIVR